MLITPSRHAAFPLACLVVLTFHLNPRALAFAQQTSVKPLETTITELVASSRKFSGKRVHVRASYHSDGRENDVLMEPNCGTSKTNPPGESQCGRGDRKSTRLNSSHGY